MISLPWGRKRDHSRGPPAAASRCGSHLPILRRGFDHMGMAAPLYYTAEMVRALPDDGNRYETVHGELLVTPAPRTWHQIVVERLRDVLRAYLQGRPEWQVFATAPAISGDGC